MHRQILAQLRVESCHQPVPLPGGHDVAVYDGQRLRTAGRGLDVRRWNDVVIEPRLTPSQSTSV